MESTTQTEILDALIGRFFVIQDKTIGSNRGPFTLRYRGRFRSEDTASIFDQLLEQLKPYQVKPLFRWDGDLHAILLVPATPKPKASNPWINLGLFILTLFSVILTGAFYGLETPLPTNPVEAIPILFQRGWPFAVSMLAILSAHEFGHYLAGRYHGVHVTLPYFIPLPFSPLGTLGAFINMKETPRNRRHLLDIGLAGPLAGLVVAVPVLLIGLKLSSLDRIPTDAIAGQMFQIEGNSILYLLSKFAVFGQLLPSPASFSGMPPALYWLKYFFTGRPFPLGGMDVMLHPVAWAGWAGILVTALNLIPAGQLDGGHVLYVLLGRKRAIRLLPFILAILVLLGFVWSTWWFWAGLILLLGRAYAEPSDQVTPLDGRRKLLAVLALVIFILVFTPVPLIVIG